MTIRLWRLRLTQLRLLKSSLQTQPLMVGKSASDQITVPSSQHKSFSHHWVRMQLDMTHQHLIHPTKTVQQREARGHVWNGKVYAENSLPKKLCTYVVMTAAANCNRCYNRHVGQTPCYMVTRSVHKSFFASPSLWGSSQSQVSHHH